MCSVMRRLEGAAAGSLAAEPAVLGPCPQVQVHVAASRPVPRQPPPVGRTHGLPCPPGGLAHSFPAGSASQPTTAVGEALGPVCPLSTGVVVRPTTPQACVRAEWAGVGELVGTLPRVYSRCSLNGSSGGGGDEVPRRLSGSLVSTSAEGLQTTSCGPEAGVDLGRWSGATESRAGPPRPRAWRRLGSTCRRLDHHLTCAGPLVRPRLPYAQPAPRWDTPPDSPPHPGRSRAWLSLLQVLAFRV